METILLVVIAALVIYILWSKKKKSAAPTAQKPVKPVPPPLPDSELQTSKPSSNFNLVIDDENESGKEYYVDSFELTGVHIPQRKGYLLNSCEEYDPVFLIHEKNNPASKRAIAVKHENKIIGYIAEHDLDDVHKFLDRISEAYIAAIDYDGDHITVEIDVEYEILRKRKKKSKKKNPSKASSNSPETELHPEDFMRFARNEISSEYLKPKKDLEDTGSFFFGKKVCISGTLDNFPYREELAHHLWELGADVDKGVGKTCDILISGDGVGPSKMKKAKAQGVQIMYEEELQEKISHFKSKYI